VYKLKATSSTLAGLLVPLLFIPANRYFTKLGMAKTHAVMTARDAKSHQVTEALNGARQIKFSAIEKKWEQIINAAREKELGAIWSTFLFYIMSLLIWTSVPILLGAAALSAYAILNKGLITAAVAFTALSVFSSLEFALSLLPMMITDLIEALVSVRRIQEHLEMPEKAESVLSGDSIMLKDVSITWPSYEEKKDAFALRDITLNFPNHKLRWVPNTSHICSPSDCNALGFPRCLRGKII